MPVTHAPDTEPSSPADVPLSQALRATTSAAHEDAEGSRFITALMGGMACRSAFTALVAQQLVVYRALEDVIREHYADHPLLAAVDDRRLSRTAALEHDLRELVGPDAEVRLADGRLPICPATVAYAHVLRERHTPERVLANHYVRYLGDLSGGQAIARLVQRHYGIAPSALTFYAFDELGQVKPYKDSYRAALDTIELTDAQRAATLAAAVESFRLNHEVFEDLAGARRPIHAAAGVAG